MKDDSWKSWKLFVRKDNFNVDFPWLATVRRLDPDLTWMMVSIGRYESQQDAVHGGLAVVRYML